MHVDGSSRRVASAVVAFVLGLAGFVAIAPSASAAPPCDDAGERDRRGELPDRLTRIRVGHRRRGRRVDPRVRHPDQREQRRDRRTSRSTPTRRATASTSTGSATTAATAPATSRPSTRRRRSAVAADCLRGRRPVSSTAATGPSPRRGPCRPTRCPACTSRKLIAPSDGGASHIVFIVRDDASHSDLLFQTSDTTWQAYNSYGGNSLYTGAPAGRAYKVSYNRPFTTRENTPRTGSSTPSSR